MKFFLQNKERTLQAPDGGMFWYILNSRFSIPNSTVHSSTMHGMSFIEVLVWISIVTILTGVMSIGIINVYRSNSYTFESAITVLSARKGLENVTDLVREARYSPSGSYPVVAMSANSFSFYADYDDDDVIELVHIFINGDALNLGVIEPSGSPAVYTGAEQVSTLVHNVRNEALGIGMFSYYSKYWAAVNDMSKILLVASVQMTIVTNTGKNGSVNEYVLNGTAFMRNLKN